VNSAEGLGRAGPAPVGRELRARYAFMGAAVELTRTVPLNDGEEVLLHGVMRLRRVGRLPRPVVLRLTAPRLSLLIHYALQPDRVWDLPRAAIREVRPQRRAVRIVWTADDSDGVAAMTLTGWTGRPAIDSTLRDAGAVADALNSWLDSPDGRLPGRRPTSHRPLEG
jgi:hypothetical protein